MNVLHFHLSDQCRFSVESKLFPEVTSKLVGAQAGHYTQNDIRDIVAYAGDRGIRVRAIILSIRTGSYVKGMRSLSDPGFIPCTALPSI